MGHDRIESWSRIFWDSYFRKESPSTVPGIPTSLQPQTDHWSLSPFPAGLCLNCWSLQELVSRDPGHFLILLEQILQKTREVRALKGRVGIGLIESTDRSPTNVISGVPGPPKGLAKALGTQKLSVSGMLVDWKFLRTGVVFATRTRDT